MDLNINVFPLENKKNKTEMEFKIKDKVLYTGKMLDEDVVDLPCTVCDTISTQMCDIMDSYGHIYRVFNKDLKHINKNNKRTNGKSNYKTI